MNDEEYRSYRELYDLYNNEVFGYLRRLTGNDRQTAEDLSQEVWISFYKSFDKVVPRGNDGIRSWLYVVSKRKFLDELDRRGREKTVSGEMFEEDSKLRMEEEVIARLMFDETLSELSEEERKLVLCRMNDIPVEWAFEGQGISRNTLRVRCTRAVQKMKAIFGAKCSGS